MYNKKILVELLSSPTIGCTTWERSSSYHFIQHLDPFVGLMLTWTQLLLLGWRDLTFHGVLNWPILWATGSIKWMKRRVTIQRCFVFIINSLWHILELGKYEPLLSWRWRQFSSSEIILQVCCFVGDHLKPLFNMVITLGMFHLQILVHINPLILKSSSYDLIERWVSTQMNKLNP